MTISFPRTNIISSVLYQNQEFKLVSRQETSRTAYGRTISKDLGSAIWMATYTTISLPNDDALSFEAALNSLDGAIQAFAASDLRRLFPRAAATGAGANDGVLSSVNANNKALALSGLAAGQVISAGDYLSFDYAGSRALHQAVETISADGSGGVSFEVRPYIRPGYSTGVTVTLKMPSALFSLVPSSVSSKLDGPVNSVVSFQAVQVI